jgi:hypothetical protein
MVRNRQDQINRNDVISASEISQYSYCSIAWYLQRCGYKPYSPLLKVGKKTHVDLGITIHNIKNEMKRSRRFAILGYLFLITAIIGIFYEVII